MFIGGISFSISDFAIQASNKNITLWVPVYFQPSNSMWCWAVSARMIGHYLYDDYSTSSIVKKIKGNTSLNNSGSSTDLTNAINYASGYGDNYVNVNGIWDIGDTIHRLIMETHFILEYFQNLELDM